jgi:hypothetical protein
MKWLILKQGKNTLLQEVAKALKINIKTYGKA